MNLRWTVGDEFLVSVGGNDKCALVWRHTTEEHMSNGDGSDALEPDVESRMDSEGCGTGHDIDAMDGGPGASPLGMPTGGDESGALKPWLGNVRRPDEPPQVNSSKPVAELSLEWCFGYSSGRVGPSNTPLANNLVYNEEGCAVYPAAALGVILDHSGATPQQTHFQGHDDDVICLAITKDRRYIASGQVASRDDRGKMKLPHVCIWDASDGRLISTIEGAHQRAICSLSFSPDGDQLVTVGQDNDNTHTLWRDVGGSWSRVEKVLFC
jgi:microtubule-associated protein-like 6